MSQCYREMSTSLTPSMVNFMTWAIVPVNGAAMGKTWYGNRMTISGQVQLFSLALAALGGTLATIHGIPATLTTSMISAGTAVAAIAQFAVKQFEPDNSPANETK